MDRRRAQAANPADDRQIHRVLGGEALLGQDDVFPRPFGLGLADAVRREIEPARDGRPGQDGHPLGQPGQDFQGFRFDGVGLDLPDMVGLDELPDSAGPDPAGPVHIHHRRHHPGPGQLGRVDLESRERPVHARELDDDRSPEDLLQLIETIPEMIDGRKFLPGFLPVEERPLLGLKAAGHQVFPEHLSGELDEDALAPAGVAAVENARIGLVVHDGADHPLEDQGRVMDLPVHEIPEGVQVGLIIGVGLLLEEFELGGRRRQELRVAAGDQGLDGLGQLPGPGRMERRMNLLFDRGEGLRIEGLEDRFPVVEPDQAGGFLPVAAGKPFEYRRSQADVQVRRHESREVFGQGRADGDEERVVRIFELPAGQDLQVMDGFPEMFPALLRG